MNIFLILTILALFLVVGVYGWFHSRKTRRLVVFGILVILGLANLFMAFAQIRRLWFPLPPF